MKQLSLREDNIRESIRHSLMQFASDRGNEKTFCPSETARQVFDTNWRDYMSLVREVCDDLVSANKLIVLQKNIVMDKLPTELSGPIRLRGRPK